MAFSSYDPNGTHHWQFDDPVNPGTSTDTDPTYTFNGPGESLVTHTVTNVCGTRVLTETVTIAEACENCDCPAGVFVDDEELINLIAPNSFVLPENPTNPVNLYIHTQLVLDNSNLTATQSFEADEKTVNDIFLNAFIGGDMNFDLPQQTQLQTIANQCIYDGGYGVFHARSLLGLSEFTVYDDKVLCQPSGGQGQGLINNGEVVAEFEIFPNPAKDKVTVVFEEQETEGFIRVTNVLGSEMLLEKVGQQSTQHSITTKGWEEGIFFVSLIFNNETIATKTLVISRN